MNSLSLSLSVSLTSKQIFLKSFKGFEVSSSTHEANLSEPRRQTLQTERATVRMRQAQPWFSGVQAESQTGSCSEKG